MNTDELLQENQALTNHFFYKGLGICVACHRRPSMVGQVLCEVCAEKRAEQRSQHREREREKSRKSMNALYRKRKSEGLCVNCGKPAFGGCVHCYECHLAAVRKGKKRYEAQRKGYREAGTCLYCGAERVAGKYFCADCLAKKQASIKHASEYIGRENHTWKGKIYG